MQREELRETAEAGVYADEARAMQGPLDSLVHATGWAYYQELLKRLRISYREQFEGTSSMEEVALIKGVLIGLQIAEEAPGLVLAQVEHDDRVEEAKVQHRRAVQIGGGEESF